MARWLLLPFVALVASCATAQSDRVRPGALTVRETEFLCAVVPEHRHRLGGMRSDSLGLGARAAELQALRTREVPRHVKCPAGRLRLRQSDRYVDFVDGVGLSADGSLAVLSGGWHVAPQAGGGGDCYFERIDGSWRLIGCKESWVI